MHSRSREYKGRGIEAHKCQIIERVYVSSVAANKPGGILHSRGYGMLVRRRYSKAADYEING